MILRRNAQDIKLALNMIIIWLYKEMYHQSLTHTHTHTHTHKSFLRPNTDSLLCSELVWEETAKHKAWAPTPALNTACNVDKITQVR